MKNILFCSFIVLLTFSCRDNKTEDESKISISDKTPSTYKSTKLISNSNRFKLTLDYLMKSDIYQINSYSNNHDSKVIRIGTRDQQSRILRFQKNNGVNELHFYDMVEWEFGGIIKNLNDEMKLRLYKLDDHNEYLCNLNVEIKNYKPVIMGIKLPEKFFKTEKSLQRYFISKVELDSILIKNPEYMNPLDDDPREYVPYYFKIVNNSEEICSVSATGGLNMRNSPSIKGEITRKLKFKEPLFVTDTISPLTVDNIDGYWVSVEDVIGNKGFVFSGYLEN